MPNNKENITPINNSENDFKKMCMEMEPGESKIPKSCEFMKMPANDCDYCSGYTHKHKEMSNKNAWFSIYEHYIEVVDDRPDGNILSFKIKYCPICGRKLD